MCGLVNEDRQAEVEYVEFLLCFLFVFPSVESFPGSVDASNKYTWIVEKDFPSKLMQPPRVHPLYEPGVRSRVLDAGPGHTRLIEAGPASRQLARGAQSWVAT